MSLWGAGSGLNAITGLKKDILLVLVPRTTICLQPVTTALWMLIWIWLIWIADRWCRPCRRDCTWIVCRVPTFRWPTSNRPGDDGRALIGHHWANDSARDCRRSKFRCPKCRPSEAGADGADASRYETSDYPPLRRNLFLFFFLRIARRMNRPKSPTVSSIRTACRRCTCRPLRPLSPCRSNQNSTLNSRNYWYVSRHPSQFACGLVWSGATGAPCPLLFES